MLGRRTHTAGNSTRYAIEYSDWLLPGESLLSATIVMNADFTATVTDVTITDIAVTPSHQVTFKLNGGSVDEIFTLDVQTTTQNPTEVKNDQLSFTVVSP